MSIYLDARRLAFNRAIAAACDGDRTKDKPNLFLSPTVDSVFILSGQPEYGEYAAYTWERRGTLREQVQLRWAFENQGLLRERALAEIRESMVE